MNTAFLLMAQYEGAAVIPLDRVVKDYFGGMLVEVFLRKVLAGEISLPVVRMDASKRCAKGVPLNDLALYLDARIAAARKECEQLKRTA